MPTNREQNGGYYAIKGFTYQFDKTLLDVLTNPHKEITLEQIQDIGIDNYYIQVKYKESQTYSPSKVKPAIIQLFNYFLENRKSQFHLYCFFKDKNPGIILLTEDILDTILGSQSTFYKLADKAAFIKSCSIEFSDNFENQFNKLLKTIQTSFGLSTEEEATVYHASFKSKLLDIAIKKKITDRIISFSFLKSLAIKNEKIIFELAHYKYLKNEKYTSYLKKEYFTFTKVNIANKERIFIFEVDSVVKDADIIQIISNIKSRYYKKDTSPAPYICLYGMDEQRLSLLKQRLWDLSIHFNDGTHFNTDKFRINDLISKASAILTITLKFIDQRNISVLLKSHKIDEIYVFMTTRNDNIIDRVFETQQFYISETKDIIKIIKP